MGFMKHFRARSRAKAKEKAAAFHHYSPPAAPVVPGRDFAKFLPETILRNVFEYVCLHTVDESYEPCERSMIGDGCMLCDLRDLASCARVRRSWYGPATALLYKCVRIDAVHYCELEEALTERRRRKASTAGLDVPAVRLQLLSRTLRENRRLAETVELLKLPYMTREACKADLARTVSVLPHLRYVDLPETFFSDEPGCYTLRNELQAACPRIQKMRYAGGSEQPFALLLQGHWRLLEIVEIARLRTDPSTMRRVLAALTQLQEVRFEDLPWLDDAVFQKTPSLPDFPAVRKLCLVRTPRVTASGLANLLSRPDARGRLTDLELEGSGVAPDALHAVLWAASQLQLLRVVETATQPLPLDPIPPLQSITLRTLHFEILTDKPELYPHSQRPSDSYYAYLSQSLLANALPALRAVYVRCPDFAENLTLVPPVPAFVEGAARPARGFSQPLEVYSKGLDELEWVFTSVSPAAQGRRGSMSGGRPLSSYSASRGLGPQWGGEARRSIVVGNGFGGFLAVPAETVERPKSSGGASWYKGHARGVEKRGSRHDLWR